MFRKTVIDDSTNIIDNLNESIKDYIINIVTFDYKNIEESNKFTFDNIFQNKMLLIYMIEAGLPNRIFKQIKHYTPFSDNDWANFLDLSIKTLQRHNKEDEYYFKSIHTEKILELAEVTNLGKEVFDSTDKFYTWLNTPSYALGNAKPNELLKNSYGKELVMSELYKIEYGNFA